MTRRKKLAISVVAILALAAAGVVAVVSFTPTMQSKFAQLREGMSYDEVVAILGEPDGGVGISVGFVWIGRDASICLGFDGENRILWKECYPDERPSFLDRMRSWFGL